MNRIVWYLVFALVIAHQDFWYWADPTVVFGMPIGLVYHIGLSIACSLVWAYVCYFAWPKELEGYDEEIEVTKK